MVKNPNFKANLENYMDLYKDPSQMEKFQKKTQNLTLELTELGSYECFGEDWNAVSNFLLNPTQL